MNLAKLLEGPAVVTHRGVSFHSRGGGVLTPEAANFEVESDAYGTLAQRAQGNSIALALTPVGVWTDDVLDVLYRWRNARIGQLITPRYDVSAIDTVTDIVTLLGADAPRPGCPIRWASEVDADKPAAITLATTYFWGASGKIYDTEAHALTDDGTGKIDFADDGTGDQSIIEQEPLIIHTYANRKITFWNGAVTVMPGMNFSTQQTLLGAVTFEAFRKNNAAWSDENSLFTITKELLNDSVPDEADIPTQEYTLGWGAAPWDSFKLRGAGTLTPQLELSEVGNDGRGVCGRKIKKVSAAAAGAPDGFSEAQLLDILQMQGGAIARGKSRIRADLTIEGAGVFATVKNAAARTLPQTFSHDDPRAGELAWEGARTPGEAAFYVGTAAE